MPTIQLLTAYMTSADRFSGSNAPSRAPRHLERGARTKSALRGWVVWWLGALLLASAHAQKPVEVALAGFAFAGSESTVNARFPYSRAYEDAMKAADTPVFKKLSSSLERSPPANLQIVTQIDELRARDRALAVALVIGAETVVSEQFGDLHKLLVLIRGQAMFFDFKSMSVIRSYPISFAYIDLLNHPPTKDDIQTRVRMVYEGAGDKPGILSRFATRVAQATIPDRVPRFLQVTSAQVSAEALDALPEYVKSEPGAAQNWLADIVGEAISTRLGVPIVPYAKGYAVGNVMSMRVSDGKVWELQLPKPDFEISANLTGLKKIKFNEIPGGATSFIYGAYAQLRIEDALKKGLNTGFKNGETRVIPASQNYVDDFPHFYDAINGLFIKAALAVDGRGDDKWVKSAASAKDIGQQLSQVKELVEQCK